MTPEMLWDLGLLFTAEARDERDKKEQARLIAISRRAGESSCAMATAQFFPPGTKFRRIHKGRRLEERFKFEFISRQSEIWRRRF